MEMLDPRAKLALTLSAVVVLFIVEDWRVLLGMVILLVFLLVALGLGSWCWLCRGCPSAGLWRPW